jgi:2-polyprenyl-3-methyl-5-hydroxy-6-metoxy-1,4-benzoquinol methylase
MYTRFADIYDALTHDIHYSRWADYLQSAFLKFGVEPKLILELGCGTGSMAIELSKRNYEVIALDSSADMLTRAYNKALENDVDILFLNQDMRDFELYGTVDIIICLLDSLNYITSLEEVKKIFRLVNNYLNPGGLFIFDINSAYKLSHTLGNEVFYELGEEISWIWKNTYDPKREITTFDLTFFVKQKNGLYERFDVIHEEKVYYSQQLIEALECNNLKLLGEYGDLTFNRPRADEERIFFIAQKA